MEKHNQVHKILTDEMHTRRVELGCVFEERTAVSVDTGSPLRRWGWTDQAVLITELPCMFPCAIPTHSTPATLTPATLVSCLRR